MSNLNEMFVFFSSISHSGYSMYVSGQMCLSWPEILRQTEACTLNKFKSNKPFLTSTRTTEFLLIQLLTMSGLFRKTLLYSTFEE